MTTRILIAENDPELRDSYARLLTRHGCQVETVSNGLDCLRMYRQFLPEVMVLEWEMLWGGGDGVLAVMRQEFPLFLVKLVLVTDNAAAVRPPKMASVPVVACLEKPFLMSELLRVIRAGESNAYSEMI